MTEEEDEKDFEEHTGTTVKDATDKAIDLLAVRQKLYRFNSKAAGFMDQFDDLFEEMFGKSLQSAQDKVTAEDRDAAKTVQYRIDRLNREKDERDRQVAAVKEEAQLLHDIGKSEQLGEGADGGGKRFNKGKNLMELTPPEWEAGLGDVSTKGSYKYDQRNWEKGMKWSTMIGCMKRHINKFLAGERYDGEGFDVEKGTTGCHHLAMVAWNALALMSYDLREIGEDDLPDLPKELFNRVNAQTSDLDVLFHPEPPVPTTLITPVYPKFNEEVTVDWEAKYKETIQALADGVDLTHPITREKGPQG